MKRLSSRQILLAVTIFALLVTAFWISPVGAADDWETYYYAARRITAGTEPLYGSLVTFAYYSNPPWVAAAVVPLTILPPKFGWAVLSALTLIMALAVLQRWNPAPGLIKALLVLSSPPMIYILLHGQIDMIVIGTVLLPQWLWPLAALTKPQVAIGLLFGVPRRHWLRAALVTSGVLGVTFVIWGFWPPALLSQATPFVGESHNLWAGLFPFQVPLGVLLIALGLGRADERFLIAGSPFLSPYAATSTLIGPWIAAISFLKSWQATAVWLSWWGVVVYRLLS